MIRSLKITANSLKDKGAPVFSANRNGADYVQVSIPFENALPPILFLYQISAWDKKHACTLRI